MSEKFITIKQHYENSPYAAFKQEFKLGGSFCVNMFYVEQDGHEFTDPPFDALSIIGVVKAEGKAEIDFGDGWKRHVVHDTLVDLQPAHQTCQFRVERPHSLLGASIPLKPLVRKLEDVGVSIDPFESLYAKMAGGKFALTALQGMWKAITKGGAANDLLVDAYVINLLAHFMQLAKAKSYWEAPVLDDARLSRVIDYIEEHFSDPVRMDDLAAIACLSTIHFSRAFKQAVGQSPHQYLTSRRIARAQELLAVTAFPVTEIGFLCGFSSSAHFASTFAQAVGQSPTRYREDYAL